MESPNGRGAKGGNPRPGQNGRGFNQPLTGQPAPGPYPTQDPAGYRTEQPIPKSEDALSAKVGFPLPGQHAWYHDGQHGAQSTTTRLDAMRARLVSATALAAGAPVGDGSACQEIQNDPDLFKFAEVIAQGLKSGMGGNPRPWMAFDPSGFMPPVAAIPLNFKSRVMVQVPGVPDAQQAVTLLNLIQAQGGLLIQMFQNQAQSLQANAFDPFCAPKVVNGRGEALGFDIEPGAVAVLDSFGVSTWDLIAEQELVWSVVSGLPTPTNAVATYGPVPNQTSVIVDPTCGWPWGDTGTPSQLTGRRVTPDSVISNRSIRISVLVQHQGISTVNAKSTPHYAEVVLRGWKLKIAGDGCPVAQSVGGTACTGDACS